MKEFVLNDTQIKLTEELLKSIINRESIIEYNELAARINPPIHHRHVGRNIGEISKLCYKLGLPFISAKVVSKNTHQAGEGFYGFYKMYDIDTQGRTEKELFKWELKKIRECSEWYKLADYLGIEIDLPRPKNPSISIITPIINELADNEVNTNTITKEMTPLQDSEEQTNIFPEEIVPDDLHKYTEGAKKQITVNAYERNSKARQDCIKIHGDSCFICGFNFEDFYGSEFKGKIHVHHKKPLSEVSNDYKVNPQEDLVPVCPNCHMIIHSKANREVYTIENVIQFIKRK
ncbi:MAG: HNH endonuclease [Candidatus Gastranaerophilales bacterium]|nr:HNH endonuclease [Candidatus Gastranaerophilales bacterium]